MQGYVDRVSGALGRALNWEHDDLALQNIQARARAPGVWMIANVLNALLLVTSNRSEAAVGYCTMDEDTSGSICPIGGIDKHFLRGWLDWMSRYRSNALQSPVTPTVPPVSELSYILNQAPTAELRPQAEGQTDEKDLMPYLVLDTIERCAIRDKKSPREVYITLRAHYTEQFSREELLSWVTKFFRLWARNQWKRERLALSFHVDDEDLDPRAWCRFPVLNSGFEIELTDLKEEVARDRSF